MLIFLTRARGRYRPRPALSREGAAMSRVFLGILLAGLGLLATCLFAQSVQPHIHADYYSHGQRINMEM
jgi:hypothetical protein